jgi:hypothetical protein
MGLLSFIESIVNIALKKSALDIEIERIQRALWRTEDRLQELYRSVPEGRACCDSCWLGAAYPNEYERLLTKRERQEFWFFKLKKKRDRFRTGM